MPASAKALEDGRRPDLEDRLTKEYRVDWTFVSKIMASRVDIERAKKRQSRFVILDEKLVDQYRVGAVRGDPFPPVIVYTSTLRAEKYSLADGLHRVVAFDLEHLPFNAYELAPETKAATITRIMCRENARHGRGTSEDERVAQALLLIAGGAKPGAAAYDLNVDENLVSKALAAQKAEGRARRIELPEHMWKPLSATTKKRMNNLGSDEVFKEVAELSYEAGMATDEISRLITLVNDASSHKKQMEIVAIKRDELQDRIQEGGGGVLTTAVRSGRTGKQKMASAMGMMLSVPDTDEDVAALYALDELDRTIPRYRDTAERLNRIADLLDKRQ